jgi:hypothetical protein
MGQSISGFKQGLNEGGDDEIVQVQAVDPGTVVETKSAS